MDSIFKQFLTKSNIKKWSLMFWERYSKIHKMNEEIKDLKCNIKDEDDILKTVDKKKKIRKLRSEIFNRIMWTILLMIFALPFVLLIIALLPIMFVLFIFVKLLLRINKKR